jgi:hypothetical protein
MIEQDWIAALLGGLVVALILLGVWAVYGRGYIKTKVSEALRQRFDTLREQQNDLGWGNGFSAGLPEGINPEDADSPDVEDDDSPDAEDDDE